jgi:hypothetical protein
MGRGKGGENAVNVKPTSIVRSYKFCVPYQSNAKLKPQILEGQDALTWSVERLRAGLTLRITIFSAPGVTTSKSPI